MTDLTHKSSAPSAVRNQGPIGSQLQVLLPQNARVLEIASGTGQHGAYFTRLRADISWQYSDIGTEATASQKAYAAENRDQLIPPVFVDVTEDNWWRTVEGVSVIYCANMIHIAPWAAAKGLAKGAGELLPTSGQLFLYGPFLHGPDSAQSNLAFAQNLKTRNPDWGVREMQDVKNLFSGHGLKLNKTISMPRDNSLLIFSKV